MLIKLEHANMAVRNIDDAIRFLQAAFPEFALRREGHNDGRRWAHVGTDDTYIALNEATQEALEQHQPYDGKPGLNHLGYEVDDVEQVRERLTAAGFRDSTYPNSHPHRKRVYFYDADGNDWEFVQYFSEIPSERNDYDIPD